MVAKHTYNYVQNIFSSHGYKLLSKEYIKLIINEIKAQADKGKIIFIAGHTNDITKFANKSIEMEDLNE